VITTAATPWGELTSRGLGWIVDNDATQLRDALILALSMESDWLQSIRYEASAFAGKTFLWQPIADKYVDTYAWLFSPAAAKPPWVTDAA
jgi:glycosyltransferase involved in cell wall biosynthesis